MTPKEKAEEIDNKYWRLNYDWDGVFNDKWSKDSALIDVNNTLEGSVGTYTPTIQLGTPGIAYCCGAFDGYLSVVRIYNRALTQTEITQNWNAQKSYFGL